MHLRRRAPGFTLIELLVVIAIISIIAAILFPVFERAKAAAKKTACISNTHQIGMALLLYTDDYGALPRQSNEDPLAVSNLVVETTWSDTVLPYVKSEALFSCPIVPLELTRKPWIENNPNNRKYGGYGYNYQYLGNSLTSLVITESAISTPSETILVTDTNGVRMDNGNATVGVYVIDPPVTSTRGSGRSTGFFGAAGECGTGATPAGQFMCRATPGQWHDGWTAVVFVDGHSKSMKLSRIDDFDGNGQLDNGWWNGVGDSSLF
jgi:prepilin-type N-terminal cleavage/methylation domain-containing protein